MAKAAQSVWSSWSQYTHREMSAQDNRHQKEICSFLNRTTTSTAKGLGSALCPIKLEGLVPPPPSADHETQEKKKVFCLVFLTFFLLFLQNDNVTVYYYPLLFLFMLFFRENSRPTLVGKK